MEPTIEKKDVKQMLAKAAVYGIALFAPLLTLINQVNEKLPLLPFLIALPLFAVAGYITSKFSKTDKPSLPFIAWSAFIGFIEALLIVFAV